jgi:hypothetical protein
MHVHKHITFIALSLLAAAAGTTHASEQVWRNGLECQAHWNARGQIGWDHRGAGNFGTSAKQVYCPVAETTSIDSGFLGGGSVRVGVIDNHPSMAVVCWAYSTQLDENVTSWGPAEFSCQNRLSCGSNSYPGYVGVSEMYIGVDPGLYHDFLGIGCDLPPPTTANNASTASWVRGTRSMQ